MLDASKINPRPGMVLAEPVFPEVTEGGIIIPVEFRPRYSPVARVEKANTKEDIRPGDLVVIEDEGMEVPLTYRSAFLVLLRDEKEKTQAMLPVEVEPLFVEMMRKFESNPTEFKDYWIRTRDYITDEPISFQLKDVLSWSLTQIPNPTYRLEYIPTAMLDVFHNGIPKLFYLLDERRILLTLRRV